MARKVKAPGSKVSPPKKATRVNIGGMAKVPKNPKDQGHR